MSPAPTLQEVFDRVKAHLLKQGSAAVQKTAFNDHSCRYLTDDGRRCAVGCLFVDDEERNKLALEQGGTVYGLADEKRDPGAPNALLDWYLGFKTDDQCRSLLAHLQSAHDGAKDSDFVANVTASLRNVAARFSLQFDSKEQ